MYAFIPEADFSNQIQGGVAILLPKLVLADEK